MATSSSQNDAHQEAKQQLLVEARVANYYDHFRIMLSTNFRSLSLHSHTSRCTQTDTPPIPTPWSSSMPTRQFIIIILTNHPHMLQRTIDFRPRTRSQQVLRTYIPNHTGNTHQNRREQLLNSLLRVDLTEAICSYLFHTHQPFPIHYVFDMSNVQVSTPTSAQS